ncbi:MAG: hypothetical protein QXO67_02355 [Candidatus Bathyarchaeia archaeon]
MVKKKFTVKISAKQKVKVMWRKVEAFIAVSIAVALTLFWLYIIMNIKKYIFILAIVGLILSTLILIYAVIVLGITAVDKWESKT